MSDERRFYVYRAIDDTGRTLYVGMSGNLPQRRASHSSGAAWYPYMARTILTGPMERRAALDLEKAEIARLNPWFNGSGASGIHKRRTTEFVSEILAPRRGEDLDFGAFARVSRTAHEEAVRQLGPEFTTLDAYLQVRERHAEIEQMIADYEERILAAPQIA